ncbi:SAM hydrolase/SAM-dependent halogenase family protein [Actinomycetospora sp. CA-101289]|uniref:SAM hydrolase/SAM-dependent halogenase family protein n=1 Tax=Actinomycetospora sp. CA-101289 TaxID=3239893 RepID=UPI003D98E974
MTIISLSSDFGVQSQGVGIMEATAYSIAPEVRLIHLMHGLPEFDITAAARTLETARYLPVGCHVCICDPGVGTDRRGIICQVNRGDYLIGPDNGVLVPASRILGGTVRVHQITNPSYMRLPVSPIFHGRDVFVPAAAHLANGVPIEDFGEELQATSLAPAPYDEALVDGDRLMATVIQINRFGSVHLNILHEAWDKMGAIEGTTARVRLPDDNELEVRVSRTFGDVAPHENVILKDDYGRVEIAKNLGSFVEEHPLRRGDNLQVSLAASEASGEVRS